ncbi:alkaline phosphatase [Flavobacterium jejuense]|uniref:Alkaline phosphatase n=1 Tax=Flavobacterium jejuense TaxID=1544455 RepID=A0ABX0IMD7_9FLAO|nr:alkaline phosphatase [Flavobacterium jejuense]NHN24878.1 alkaline phosphatase [Flavobacterium jejuense]
MSKVYNVFLFFLFANLVVSQNTTYVHSHNDYSQAVPFWNAFSAGANSIEVDVFLKNNTLYATHSKADIIEGRTIENLYLEPLQKVVSLKLGDNQNIQLLIDVKSEAYKTLDKIIEILKKYPDLIKNNKIGFIISGNRPKPDDYKNYPEYITFDYQSLDPISDEAWEKVALISLDFAQFSSWNGKGRLIKEEKEKIIAVIKTAHSYKKPFRFSNKMLFRFWGTPDSKTAWKCFVDLGVDFICTDHPFACINYVKSLPQRVYTNQVFSEVYTPSFQYDQKSKPVKNVILLIGDGNGLTQLSSATLANKGSLTITQLKSIGFIKTQSADDFTTDSAAAGTALATGQKTYNRAIGVDTYGNPLINITEIAQKNHFKTGIITTDDVTGATPAAFYAHQKDRGEEYKIAQDLLKSNLNLFIGGGKNQFKDFGNFEILDSPKMISESKSNKIGFFMSDKAVLGVLEGRANLLAEVTANSLIYFKAKEQPFFLMVEGAQIDSYGHMNKVSGIVSEGIDFDKAVTEAIKFADANEGTLVIITADHETSGFSIPQGDLKKHQIEGGFTTQDHTGTLVPIFAYGPHSDEFAGVYENNEVFHKILSILKLSK